MSENKNNLVRFSITMPDELLAEFDKHIALEGRENRSDVLRGLVRRYIAENRWKGSQDAQPSEVYGTVTLVYDHHVTDLMSELTGAQHDHGDVILCSTHVHVDHATCLECIIMKGISSDIQNFIDSLKKIRGIKSLEVVITSDI